MNQSQREWTVLSMLEWTTDFFKEKDVPSPRLSIEWLLADVLNVKRLDLYLLYDRPLSQSELDALRSMVKRRASHEPLQYITGYTDFLGCRIHVNPAALIPRQETEQLAELILKHERPGADSPLKLLDIGTGTGCIPIAIKQKRSTWSCIGIDISDKALELAKENARLNDVNIEWQLADLTDSSMLESVAAHQLDIIVSNPPYIYPSEKKEMELEVYSFEPELALFHEEPLQLYETIIRYAAKALAPGGSLYLECNHSLTDRVSGLCEKQFNSSGIYKDLDGKKRFVKATI